MPELNELLAAYTALIDRYHKTLDLVSEAGRQALPRHIADALAYARLIEEEVGRDAVIVDVGSGAGLPGIVIAAALPSAKVFLVERRRRRTAFLELASGNLGLDNTEVFGGDVLDLQDVCADVVTAQAVADIPALVRLTRHLHRDPCWVVSRRGETELEGLSQQVLDALGLVEGSAATGAESAAAQAKLVEVPLEERGSLVAVRLPGGSACLPSA